MIKKSSYTYDELIQCGHGKIFGENNAQLPIPPMLMMDRIVNITEGAGLYGKGQIIAELDIKEDFWFFGCHFHNDPVMPGCLGLDAMWQLLGFYLGWKGVPGRGRATGVGQVKFSGQVFPSAKLVTYELNIKKLANRKISMAVADGTLAVDGKEIYKANDLKTIMSIDL